ncbi:MAG: YvcK family protein [Gammaproteobacteria bacterium]|nr:YvcK family protein [Gammaproteobacteria bacterium]
MSQYVDPLNLEALESPVAAHGLFHEDDQAATLTAVESAIECRIPAAERVDKLVALGGGSGILAVLKPANSLGIFVSEWQSSIDDGGSTNVILDNFISRGLGRGYSIGDLVSSLFKGFAWQPMLQGILDDQGRIMLAKAEDVEKGLIPETGVDGESFQAERIVVFGKQYGLMDPSTRQKNVRDVHYVDTLQQWAEVSLARNGEMFTVAKDPGFIRFANGLRNLLKRVQPYIDEEIIELSGASVRNLLVVAALDYLQLIDLTTPRYMQGSNSLLACTDDEIARYHYGLALLTELVGIRGKAKVGIAHRNPATVFATFRDVVVTVDHKGEKFVFSVQPGQDGTPGQVHIHGEGAGAAVTTSNSNNTTVELWDSTIRVVLGTGKDRWFSLQIGSCTNADVIDVYDQTSGGYVDWQSRHYPMSQDGTGLFRFADGAEGVFRYQPIKCATGAKVYVRSRTIFRQTHVTETVSYSPVINDGIAEPDTQEKVRNDKSGNVEDVTIYRASRLQQLEENPEVLREIESDVTRTITIGPGSFYTSVMPYFRIHGVVEALQKRRQRDDIPIKLILNPTIDNETVGYQTVDIIEKFEQVAGAGIGEIVSEISLTRLDIDKLEQHLGQFGTNAKWFMEQIGDNPELVDEVGLEYVRLLECIYDKKTSRPGVKDEMFDDDGSAIKIRGAAIARPTRQQYIEAKLEQLYAAARQVVEPEVRISASAASVAAKRSRGGLSPTLTEMRDIAGSRSVAVVEEFVAGISFSQSRIPGEPATPRVVLMDDRTRFVLEENFGLIQHSQIIDRAVQKVRQSNQVPGDVSDKQIFMRHKNALRQEIQRSGSPSTADYLDQLTSRSMEHLLKRTAGDR